MNPTPTRIGFTGTRHGMTTRQQDTLHTLLTHLHIPGAHFHHGDCIGADATAAWDAHRLGYHIDCHPPTNPKHRAWVDLGTIHPEAPYHDRNQHIINAAHILLAAPKTHKPQTGGTWWTLNQAIDANHTNPHQPTFIITIGP